jgi:hypothetical protein
MPCIVCHTYSNMVTQCQALLLKYCPGLGIDTTMYDEEKKTEPLKVSETRRSYNTTLRTDLMKGLRVRAAILERRQNDLLEEAIKDLLKKYDNQE